MRSENELGGRSFIEAARRAQIVECAIETIASLGYSRSSLAQIARRARISKGVISYHFADKDDLIEQVLIEVLGAFESYMRPRIQAECSSASRMLHAFIESNVAFMTAHRTYVLVLVDVFTNARRQDGKPLVDPDVYESGLKGLEQILRRGQETGEFRLFSPRVMAVSIRQALDAIAPQMLADPNLDLDAYGRELTTMFDLATRAH